MDDADTPPSCVKRSWPCMLPSFLPSPSVEWAAAPAEGSSATVTWCSGDVSLMEYPRARGGEEPRPCRGDVDSAPYELFRVCCEVGGG